MLLETKIIARRKPLDNIHPNSKVKGEVYKTKKDTLIGAEIDGQDVIIIAEGNLTECEIDAEIEKVKQNKIKLKELDKDLARFGE